MRWSLLALLIPFTAQAGQIFFSGAETPWKKNLRCLEDDCWGDNQTQVKYGHPYAVRQVTADGAVKPRAGKKMWRFEIREGDTGLGGNCRNTLQQYFPKAGREYWIGYSMFFPRGFEDVFGRSCATSGSGCANGSITGMGGEGGQYNLSTRYGMRLDGRSGEPLGLFPYQRKWHHLIKHQLLNRWVDFVFHFTTGDNRDSKDFYEYWLDGKHEGRRSGTLWPVHIAPGRMIPDGTQMDFKPGQYFCVGREGKAGPRKNIMYFDEFRVWEGSGGSYEKVAPGGEAQPMHSEPDKPTGLSLKVK